MDEVAGLSQWEGEPVVVTKHGDAYYFDNQNGEWKSMPSVPGTRDHEGDLRSQIHEALKSYRTHHLRYEGDGGGMQLVDVLSPDGGSIGPGKDELWLLADHIAYEVFKDGE